MTNPIATQTEILSLLTEILCASAPPDFDEIHCDFDYKTEEDGSWSVGSTFSFTLGGKKLGAYLNDRHGNAPALVARLHKAMYEHTGGAWQQFSITMEKGGQATVRFQYDRNASASGRP